MDWAVFGGTLVTLFVIMDPIGNAPIFMIMTRGRSPSEARRMTLNVMVAVAAIVAGFALAGELLLRALGVSVDSLSIAGGLLLLLVGLEMLRGQLDEAPPDQASVLVPLATPLLAGPGAIATAMVLTRQNPGAEGRVSVLAGIGVAVVLVGVVFLFAERVSRVLTPSALRFFTRVLGLLLATLAVELVVDGVTSIVERHRG